MSNENATQDEHLNRFFFIQSFQDYQQLVQIKQKKLPTSSNILSSLYYSLISSKTQVILTKLSISLSKKKMKKEHENLSL